eukprot:3172785-Rhodomonas_salina.1
MACGFYQSSACHGSPSAVSESLSGWLTHHDAGRLLLRPTRVVTVQAQAQCPVRPLPVSLRLSWPGLSHRDSVRVAKSARPGECHRDRAARLDSGQRDTRQVP